MIVKGLVSAIYPQEEKISVILPEYDNMTTKPLSIYGNPNMEDFAVNDFVAVLVFNNDLNDAMILASTAGAGQIETSSRLTEITLLTANWVSSEDETYYMQDVAIPDSTANSKVDLQPTPEHLVMLMNEEITMYVGNDEGDIKAYAIGGIPSADITIQAIITEVVLI